MKEFQNYKSSNKNNLLFVLPVDHIDELMLNETAFSLAEQVDVVDLLVLTKNLDKKSIDILINILNEPTVERNKPKSSPQDQSVETIAVKGKNKLNYIIENTESNTFSEIYNESFNYALKNNYTWYSLIEPEDTISKNWIKNFNLYQEGRQEIDGFLPLIKQSGPVGFAGFINEASWVEGFSEVAGFFDLNLVLRFNCLNVTGCIFKTESIKSYSEEIDGIYKPMKESMKLNYNYEFFLRMIYNDLKFYTIPRVCYDHKINRTVEKVNYFNSKLPLDLAQKSPENGGMSTNEIKFWTDLAKKEYFFDNDRKKLYQST